MQLGAIGKASPTETVTNRTTCTDTKARIVERWCLSKDCRTDTQSSVFFVSLLAAEANHTGEQNRRSMPLLVVRRSFKDFLFLFSLSISFLRQTDGPCRLVANEKVDADLSS